MTRMTRFVPMAAAVLGLVAPVAAVQAQKEGKPTVAILVFENGAFGKDARDYDGLGKSVPAFLVTEMAGNPNIRVIERDQVQKLVDEQNLVTGGKVDKASAIKVGKLLGAQHMIFGSYMIDPKQNFRIDARAVNVETGEIEHTDRVDDKADNIMSAISGLATKLNTGLHLPAHRVGDATPAESKPAAQQAGAVKTAYAPVTTAPQPKLPMRVAVMYGKALDLKDKKDPKAVELFKKVLDEFPTYEPATRELASMSK
jgi:curli biogenesis system outer membrane secretion channel CsgG